MKTIVSTFKQLALFAGLMIFCFSLTVCGERQVDHNTPTTPEAAPTTACKQRKSIGGALNEAATLAFDKVLKTYTLTFSPKQDSTLVGIICDTSAYELSKLVGQVKFDGGIRAAGEDAPKPTAAGQGYYSVELKAPPRRKKAVKKPTLPQDHPILGTWEWIETADLDNKVYTPREGYYIQLKSDFALTHSDQVNQPSCSEKTVLAFSLSEMTKGGKTRQTVTTQYYTYVYEFKEGYMYLYRYYNHGWLSSNYDKFKKLIGKSLTLFFQINQVKSYPKDLLKIWHHAYKEDNYNKEGWTIYRPSPPYKPPLSRFRQYYSFRKDHTCKYLVLAPNDAHFSKIGRWEYFENPERIEIYNNKCKLIREYKIIELNENILKVREINKPFKQ